MEPEKLINAFLQVWHNCPEVFERTGAIRGLESMLGEIDQIKQESIADIAERIETLCDEYSGLAEAITANRKPKPKKSDDNSVETTLHNRFTELSQVLQEIANKSQRNG
jgi:DNA-binding ferritin-like protein